MTLWEAVVKSLKLWEWLKDNPDEGKNDCPTNILPSNTTFGCFACEYAGKSAVHIDKISVDCRKCFLLPLWFGKEVTHEEYLDIYLKNNIPCVNAKGSPFNAWQYYHYCNNAKMKKEEASKIVKYHKKLLKGMKVE